MALKKTLLLFLSTILIFSCDRFMPGGFWLEYKKEKITQNFSDQGPWGGSRTILWTTSSNQTFTNAVSYAINHNWTFIDSVHISENIPISQLSSHFPKWFNDGGTVLRFTSEMLNVDSDTDSTYLAEGYVIFNETRTQMVVYHKWGQ
ncbi:hypothetical protein BWI96_11715 [Siphonobacter sp. SORGH_AS_0500]|uniref:hypothetical protein n=1 Tax=Siphonobacter sp. SORGH_AS_0500 TaxID=1864824 RepID=UPI000CC79A6F|nr:hypothetical protein [Siphonobacter sp. SORGH_AS_0500]PKK36515.1 hypothetical protein BWI96_11715 [Siphonobacter sp. SORGH_AS_0500]